MELDLPNLINLAEGSVDEMKEFVRNHDLDEEEIGRILEAERSAKDRKTAVRFLESELKRLQEESQPEEATLGKLKAVKEGNHSKIVLDIGGVKFDLRDHPEFDFSRKLSRGEDEGTSQNALMPGLGGYAPAGQQNGAPAQVTSGRATAGSGQRAPTSKRQQRPERNNEMEELARKLDEVGRPDPMDEDLREQLTDELESVEESLSEEESSAKSEQEESETVGKQNELEEEIDELEEKKKELKDRFDLDDEELEGKDKEELEALENNLEEKEEMLDELEESFDVDREDLKDRTLEELKDLEQRIEEKQDLISDLQQNGYERSELEEMSIGELRDLEEQLEDLRQDISDRFEGVDRDTLKGKTAEELGEFVDRMEARKQLVSDLEQYGYGENELEDKSLDELRQEMELVEKKKSMLEEMDTSFPDEKLSEISVEQLKDIKSEKDHRKELIEELKEEGMDESMLRNSSTPDLERLHEDVSKSEEQLLRELLDSDVGEIRERLREESLDEEKLLSMERNGRNREEVVDLLTEDEKDEEELEREAEEDLEMLMGATEESDKNKEEMESLNKLESIKQKIDERWKKVSYSSDRENEKETKKREQKVLEVLERYSRMEEEEAVIKTAHVMKGYLEFRLGIDREMTYNELAEALEDVEASADLQTLTEFFEDLSVNQYTGEISADKDEVISVSKAVIDELG